VTRGNDVSDDVRPGSVDVKVRTTSSRGNSTSSSSSTSSRPGAVSASSSEDLFDEQPRDGAADVCGEAERPPVPVDSTSTTTSDAADTSRQPSTRPTTSTAQLPASRADPTAAAAHVATFQITPSLRQRAFPRTNPAYVGTYRRDRPPTYRRLVEACPTTTSLGVASELRSSASSPHGGSRRPTSDVGLQRALIQQTGDVVFSARRAGHQCTTIVTHQRTLHDCATSAGTPTRRHRIDKYLA